MLSSNNSTSTFLHALSAASLRQEGAVNAAVCPVSVLMGTVAVALAATKNTETHKEACKVLGMDAEVRVQLSIATSMWCENVKPAFTLLCQQKLQAQVRGLGGCKAINAWVTENTNGMIKEVMDTDPDQIGK